MLGQFFMALVEGSTALNNSGILMPFLATFTVVSILYSTVVNFTDYTLWARQGEYALRGCNSVACTSRFHQPDFFILGRKLHNLIDKSEHPVRKTKNENSESTVKLSKLNLPITAASRLKTSHQFPFHNYNSAKYGRWFIPVGPMVSAPRCKT